MKIIINKEEVRNENIENFVEYQKWTSFSNYLTSPAGVNEYRLYSYLAKKVSKPVILDIGTYMGNSAVALSTDESKHVISYDIIELDTHKFLKKNNIEFRVGNFMNDDINYNDIDLIVIDVDPHDGIQEPPMIKYLVDNGWEGILLLDDISHETFPGMIQMWNDLPYEKYDLKDIGHFSGTGLINIGDKFTIEIL
jgi:hypothetical protein